MRYSLDIFCGLLALVCVAMLDGAVARAQPRAEGNAALAPVRLPMAEQVVGRWRTVDEHSHKATSIVLLSFDGREVVGKVEKILKEGVSAAARCVKCKAERKNQPLVGMTILWGLKNEGDALGGGQVLDPSTGKIYRAKMRFVDANHIELRGYVGIPALGRSQQWEREQP